MEGRNEGLHKNVPSANESRGAAILLFARARRSCGRRDGSRGEVGQFLTAVALSLVRSNYQDGWVPRPRTSAKVDRKEGRRKCV